MTSDFPQRLQRHSTGVGINSAAEQLLSSKSEMEVTRESAVEEDSLETCFRDPFEETIVSEVDTFEGDCWKESFEDSTVLEDFSEDCLDDCTERSSFEDRPGLGVNGWSGGDTRCSLR